jgi:hypothetical protein
MSLGTCLSYELTLQGNWCKMPTIKAKLLTHKKERNADGHITEIKIWIVPVSEHTPHGVKYSFVYIVNGIRIIGYDNERGKGDHRHIGGKEYPYYFVTPSQLLADFEADIEAYQKGDL